jgi:hypothetical protein
MGAMNWLLTHGGALWFRRISTPRVVASPPGASLLGFCPPGRQLLTLGFASWVTRKPEPITGIGDGWLLAWHATARCIATVAKRPEL